MSGPYWGDETLNRLKLSLIAIFFMTFLGACGQEEKPPAEVSSPTPEEDFLGDEVDYSLSEFSALGAETLIRGADKTLVKFVQLEVDLIAGFGEFIEVDMDIFILPNGKAKIFTDWVFPDLADGAEKNSKIKKTTLVDLPWSLFQSKLVLGDDWIVIQKKPDTVDEFTGMLQLKNFNPPETILKVMIPEIIEGQKGFAIEFKVVTELLSTSKVKEIF